MVVKLCINDPVPDHEEQGLAEEGDKGCAYGHDGCAEEAIAYAAFIEEEPSIDDGEDASHSLDGYHVGSRNHGHGEVVADYLGKHYEACTKSEQGLSKHYFYGSLA